MKLVPKEEHQESKNQTKKQAEGQFCKLQNSSKSFAPAKELSSPRRSKPEKKGLLYSLRRDDSHEFLFCLNAQFRLGGFCWVIWTKYKRKTQSFCPGSSSFQVKQLLHFLVESLEIFILEIKGFSLDSNQRVTFGEISYSFFYFYYVALKFYYISFLWY